MHKINWYPLKEFVFGLGNRRKIQILELLRLPRRATNFS